MDPGKAYRETVAQGGNSSVHLVVMLYEQAARDLRQAASAMARGDVEARTRELDHALAVVGQLQATLDLDRGGDVARNLDRYYDLLRTSLMEAQVTVSPQVLEQQIAALLSLREAWLEVERAEAHDAPSVTPPPASGSRKVPASAADWRA